MYRRTAFAPALLLATTLTATLAMAQPATNLRTTGLPPIPKLEVRRATTKIAIDGKLTEEAWRTADHVTFQFPWNEQKGARQKTTARLLWDELYLYIAYDCEDMDITAQFEKRDDPTYRDDAVEAFINPNPAQTDVYIGLEMNARAVLYDYVYFGSRYLLKRLNLEGVQLATHINGTLNARGDKDQGWTLEVAIPFTEFEGLNAGKTPNPGDTWTINLNRWDGVEPERRHSLWSDSALVNPNPHNAKRFGSMVFVK